MSNLRLTQEKLDALRSEYRPRRSCGMLKYPRPKTKPEYQSIYPWIILDETDPHFVFCVVCECRLSAKRSDLGKHEGSIKHAENAQRKSFMSKSQPLANDIKWEYNEEDKMMPMQFDTSVVCKTEAEHGSEDNDEEEEEDDADEDETQQGADAEADTDRDVDYEPDCKRRASETDSQNSGLLDYLPVQVTINEMPHGHIAQASQASTYGQPAATAPQPCRITIKKVTAQATAKGGNSSTSNGPHEISSKATITPISGGCYTPVRQTPMQSYSSRQLQSYQVQHLTSIESPTRDSLDLFFDSICATVKALPPKLATEGKIRVMQLIGELELRALNERDGQPTAPATAATAEVGGAAVPATDAPASSQQNATVASTTK